MASQKSAFESLVKQQVQEANAALQQRGRDLQLPSSRLPSSTAGGEFFGAPARPSSSALQAKLPAQCEPSRLLEARARLLLEQHVDLFELLHTSDLETFQELRRLTSGGLRERDQSRDRGDWERERDRDRDRDRERSSGGGAELQSRALESYRSSLLRDLADRFRVPEHVLSGEMKRARRELDRALELFDATRRGAESRLQKLLDRRPRSRDGLIKQLLHEQNSFARIEQDALKCAELDTLTCYLFGR